MLEDKSDRSRAERGSNDKANKGGTSRTHLNPRKQNDSSSSREQRDVEREGAGQDADPPPVPPKSGISKRAPEPSILQSGESESTLTPTLQSHPLTDCTGHSATPVPDHTTVVPKPEPDWKNTTTSAAKLLLRTVERASDALPPLKSAVGGICAILENCEVLSAFVYLALGAYCSHSK